MWHFHCLFRLWRGEQLFGVMWHFQCLVCVTSNSLVWHAPAPLALALRAAPLGAAVVWAGRSPPLQPTAASLDGAQTSKASQKQLVLMRIPPRQSGPPPALPLTSLPLTSPHSLPLFLLPPAPLPCRASGRRGGSGTISPLCCTAWPPWSPTTLRSIWGWHRQAPGGGLTGQREQVTGAAKQGGWEQERGTQSHCFGVLCVHGGRLLLQQCCPQPAV